MTNTNVTVIMAFNTKSTYNRLTQLEQVELITKLTAIFDGATLTEHMGGYTMANGEFAIEYSYTLEMFDVDPQTAMNYFIELGQKNEQESIIFNGEFIYPQSKAFDQAFLFAFISKKVRSQFNYTSIKHVKQGTIFIISGIDNMGQ